MGSTLWEGMAPSPTPPRISRSTSKELLRDLDLRLICTICTGWTPVSRIHTWPFSNLKLLISIDTPLTESIPALDEIRKAGKTKYIGLSECSAATLRKANSSAFLSSQIANILLTVNSCQDWCYPSWILSLWDTPRDRRLDRDSKGAGHRLRRVQSTGTRLARR